MRPKTAKRPAYPRGHEPSCKEPATPQPIDIQHNFSASGTGSWSHSPNIYQRIDIKLMSDMTATMRLLPGGNAYQGETNITEPYLDLAGKTFEVSAQGTVTTGLLSECQLYGGFMWRETRNGNNVFAEAQILPSTGIATVSLPQNANYVWLYLGARSLLSNVLSAHALVKSARWLAL